MPELTLSDRPAATTAPADRATLEPELERYRVELTGHCYRMLGSAFEAEDAVQETFVRAWRALDRFEGRSALRSWLYRIATNVCLDMLGSAQRRARPMDLGEPTYGATALGAPLPDSAWIEPVPDARVVPAGGDPADVAIARESVRLAFIAALQALPPRQRAVLILREVLRWRADEVARLLDTSVASVNSALQRARATLAARPDDRSPRRPLDEIELRLVEEYVDAFQRYDMEALTAVLHKDASWSMPPWPLWLRSHREIVAWCLGPGAACRGSRLVPVAVNGAPGFAHYKRTPDGGYEAWSLQVLEVRHHIITGITFFLDTQKHYPLFGLPLRIEG